MYVDPKMLVSNGDTLALLHRSLLHSIVDNGGDGRHVLKLLEDCKGDRTFFNALAQQIIGRIWELTRTPVDLGPIDFNTRLRDFMDEHSKVEVIPGARSIDWTDSRPKRPCRHILKHFPAPMSYGDIRTAPVEHAGIRELILYIERLAGEDLSGNGIIAAGSQATYKGLVDEMQPTFAAASVFLPKPHISWHGTKRPDTDRWGITCFYLVRQSI